MPLKEKYYGKYDTFKIEGSGQQVIVVARPTRKSDQWWEYTVRLIDNSYDTTLDVSACQPGMTTRWISNYHPELHEEGNTKWQSNVELMRGYISTHRVDATYSALYAAMENVFVHMGDGKNSSAEKIYKMTTVERNLMENFLQARNQGMLLSKSNINPQTGKPTIVDPKSVCWGLAA